MGNGPGLTDEEAVVLTADMIEQAALKSMSNFGRPTIIMGTPQMMQSFGWEPHPEYSGTAWCQRHRLTKREHAFAKLQVFLTKFGLQKHLQDYDLRRADCELATKRLKRARWAKYQQSKSR